MIHAGIRSSGPATGWTGWGGVYEGSIAIGDLWFGEPGKGKIRQERALALYSLRSFAYGVALDESILLSDDRKGFFPPWGPKQVAFYEAELDKYEASCHEWAQRVVELFGLDVAAVDLAASRIAEERVKISPT